MFKRMIENEELKVSFKENKLAEKEKLFIQELIVGFGELKDSYCENDEQRQMYAKYEEEIKERKKTFLFEIVNNTTNKVDVDKWDYFARDCYQLGIRNNFDHLRYMQSCCVLEIPDSKTRIICARDKEIENIYNMFHTRHRLHRAAYQHKTSVVIEHMITEAFGLANDYLKFTNNNGEMRKLDETGDDMDFYIQVTDNIFYKIANFNKFDNTLPENDSTENREEVLENMVKARQIITNVQRRKLYKFLGQVNILNVDSILRKENNETTSTCGPNETVQAHELGIVKQQEDEIKTILANFRNDPFDERNLSSEMFVVDIADLHYGMGNDNPIDNMYFYSKTDPEKPIKVDKFQHITQLLPRACREQRISVYFKKRDDIDKLNSASKAFEKWQKKVKECLEKVKEEQEKVKKQTNTNNSQS